MDKRYIEKAARFTPLALAVITFIIVSALTIITVRNRQTTLTTEPSEYNDPASMSSSTEQHMLLGQSVAMATTHKTGGFHMLNIWRKMYQSTKSPGLNVTSSTSDINTCDSVGETNYNTTMLVSNTKPGNIGHII